jgi:predicted MPP superfamily phosphohydrolase
MTRVAWLTDIHLEFLESNGRLAFANHLAESMPDIVLVGGDTGIASNFASFLQTLEKGKISDDEFLPHFACKVVGEVLRSVMAEHPECKLTVLCGHTHSPGVANILPNLFVKTGSAEYGYPRLQEVMIIE